jgi:C4-dicarboxylate transporter
VTSLTSAEWITVLAERLGLDPPSGAEVDALLGLASAAAHASERTAAPISTWLVATAGLPPEEALAMVQALADELGAASG